MILLSWPPAALSPNAHIFWATRAKAVKSYRKEAWVATINSKDKVEGDGLIDLYVVFYPPDKRRYDLDNRLASIKSGLDGIADGLKVDDRRFRLIIEMGAVIKGGEVRVIVT
jgi:crossover junction endodeoxyribonuclease RusA